MEFTYNTFHGRLVLNPNDCILRFENKENFRVYERSYFEREFVEFTALGGLDFVGRMLSSAFHSEKKTAELSVRDFTSSANAVEFTLDYSNPFLSNPLEIQFKLPAIRKENAGADLEDMNRKMKAMNDVFEKKMLQLETTLKEVEERCSGHVVFPGCEYAIPTDTTSLKLVKNNTATPDNFYYSTVYPGMKMTTNTNYPTLNISQPFGNQSSYTQWQVDQGSYVHTDIKSLENLKYLKSMVVGGTVNKNGRPLEYSLTLTGMSLIQDYSPIGTLTQLTSLTICSARVTSYANNQVTNTNAGDNPSLNNISWIRNLKHLQSVCFLGCNQLVDITPLKDLPHLRSVDIRETGVKNTEFLSSKVEVKK